MTSRVEVKRLRGTSVQNAAYTGPEGVIVVGTPVDGKVWVHDGSTPGGFPIGGGITTLPIPVAEGGTGDVMLTAHAVLLGEGTSPIGFATIGTAGRVLTDNGSGADPTFQVPASDTVATGVSAAGTDQSGATALTARQNVISTVGSGAGVKLPAATAGGHCYVRNSGANALLVYPASSAAIDALGTNNPITVQPDTMGIFISPTTTTWYSK